MPPTTEDQKVAWLRLLRSRRVGVSTFYRLMGDYGCAETALEHLPEIARAAGVSTYEPCPDAVVQAEMKSARDVGASLLCRGDAHYPKALADLDDAPPMLWSMGTPDVFEKPMIALVGARNASSLGTRMARALAGQLADAGYVIVSGLARGVDTAAHISALDTGTVAVLGGGVDVLYPAENAKLAQDIVAQGGIRLSEQPMGLQPQARHFPARNRIISGIAQAVVVVEAAPKSGSLITARTALDQGRDVMAVPGHPFDARAGGCNMLLRDGARLVRNADDIIEALKPLVAPIPEQPAQPPKPKHTLAEAARLHQKILDQLGPSPVGEDQLIRDLGATSRAVSPALTDLELDGRVHRHPGGLISRVS
ncbi:DNA-processing protein DprA [Marivita sp. S0852]|uniref:DNA-processing protein DprA n=1 Tax=Marivita sp. S0852 TaxID=3373893 RepID=UPI0039819FF2